MPVLCKELGLLLYSAPATGSTALLTCFLDAGLGQYYPDSDVIANGKRLAPRKHATPRQMRRAGLITQGIEEMVWAVGIRNPFSFHVAKFIRNREVRLRQARDPSSWISRLPDADRQRYVRNLERQSGWTFGQYLRNEFQRYTEPQALQRDFHDGVQFFLHQEDSQRDLTALMKAIGGPSDLQMRRINVTRNRTEPVDYREYYDDELIELVLAWNAPSFARFPEYSFAGYQG